MSDINVTNTFQVLLLHKSLQMRKSRLQKISMLTNPTPNRFEHPYHAIFPPSPYSHLSDRRPPPQMYFLQYHALMRWPPMWLFKISYESKLRTWLVRWNGDSPRTLDRIVPTCHYDSSNCDDCRSKAEGQGYDIACGNSLSISHVTRLKQMKLGGSRILVLDLFSTLPLCLDFLKRRWNWSENEL